MKAAVIREEWVDLIDTMPEERQGHVYRAVCRYAINGTEPELSGAADAIFRTIRPMLDVSAKRRKAQEKGVQNRLQNKLQSRLQNESQNNTPSHQHTENEQDKENEPENKEKKEKKPPEKKEKKERIQKSRVRESFANLLPDHLLCSDVAAKWKEWEEYRRTKRKPISLSAARIQMQLLKEFERKEVIEIIDFSIANDYQGLFPPKHRPIKTNKDHTGI